MDYEQRKIEMIHMRRDKISYQEIADIYNISRQRVHQVIGDCVEHYHVNKYERFVESNGTTPELTDKQLAEKIGVSTETIYTYRSKEFRNSERSDGKTYRGILKVSEELALHGISNIPTGASNGYNILTEDGVKIIVRITEHSNFAPSRNNISPIWHFNFRLKKYNCDFFILYIVPKETMFIVPAPLLMRYKYKEIYFCYPTARPELSKWMKYENKFELLEGEE